MSDTPGVNICYGWTGQVVDEKNWQKSQTGVIHNPSDTKGETFSYKVRIIGRHTSSTPSNELPFASIALPVTAGGGLAGSVQTPNIRQGSYVAGFYRDGKDGNEPYITYVFPSNPKTNLFPGDPPTGFTPRSGFTNKPVPTKDINAEGSKPTESVDPNIYTTSDKDKFIDGKFSFSIPKTKACEGPSGPLKGIQKTIGEAIQLINLTKAGLLGSTSDLLGTINKRLNSLQAQLTKLSNTLIGSMRTFIINKINKELTSKLEWFDPQKRITYSKEFESITDIIFCIFQKILKNLYNNVKSLFDSLIDKYINAPLCVAENFIAGLISSIFNQLTNAINSALEALGISNIMSQIFSALNVLVAALEFLTCEDELNCEMPEQWSIFSGPSKFIDDIGDKIDQKIAGITSSLSNNESPPACNTSQLPCGPPTVNFVSSSGSGAAANPIVSASGSIIGFDIVSGGKNYTTSPVVEISDGCGNGSGAYGIAITKKGSLDKVVVVDGGAGYLQYPDGSTGGNGFIFSEANDIIIFNETNGYSVYKEETTVDVIEGDLVYAPPFIELSVYSPEGELLQELIGKGLTVPITIEVNGLLSLPKIQEGDINIGRFPSSDGSYPVVLTIDDIAVVNSGANYQKGDTVMITPSNGAEISVDFDENGMVKDVVVINGGIGFTEIPDIRIISRTGFNAKLIPVFRVIRIGDMGEEQDVIPENTPIIKIIDCVGVVQK